MMLVLFVCYICLCSLEAKIRPIRKKEAFIYVLFFETACVEGKYSKTKCCINSTSEFGVVRGRITN